MTNLVKKTIGVFALTALVMGGMTSCADDLPILDEGPVQGAPLEKEATYYLNFRVGGGNNSGTRADIYDNGSGRESVINNIKLVFYDAAGNVVGDPISAEEGAYVEIKPKNNNTDWKTENAAGTVEKYYQQVVKLDLLRGQSLPAYVMCFVNPTETGIGTWTLQQVEEKLMSTFSSQCEADPEREITAGEVFAMSNSVYYDDNPPAGQSRALVRAVSIPTDALKRTEAEAKADGVPTVNIFVERRAVKLTVTRAKEASNEFSDAQLGFDFEFVPEKWALNCFEDKSYVSKNFREENDFVTGGGGLGAKNYEWDKLVERMGANNSSSNWEWNNKLNHRSFWAFSPSYYALSFPLVSDDVKDPTADVDHTDDGFYDTGYHSYQDIIDSHGTSLGNSTYCHENTLGAHAINSATNILAAIPSVVLVGKNKMKLGGKEIVIRGETPTFYRRASGIYFKDDELTILQSQVEEEQKSKFKGLMQAMASGLSLLYYEYNGTNDKGETIHEYRSVSTLNYAELSSIFEIVHPSKEIRGDVAVPERNVTLQLKAKNTVKWTDDKKLETSANTVILVRNDQTLQPVTEANYSYVNRELLSRAGYAETYTDGMSFYNVPIKHLGFYSDLNKNQTEDLSTFKWETVKVGWFGLVRNHAYSMELGDITKLGTGILDPDQPIVPDKNKESYFINYRINVLQWRVVPTQKPIL